MSGKNNQASNVTARFKKGGLIRKKFIRKSRQSSLKFAEEANGQKGPEIVVSNENVEELLSNEESGQTLTDSRNKQSSNSNQVGRLFSSDIQPTSTPKAHLTQAASLPDKLEITIYLGTEDEDFDAWWEDLKTFFKRFDLTEKAKISLFKAHLGGDARMFIQSDDFSKIDSVEKFHQLFREKFCDKYDWSNVLMNISQKPDEKIRPFSLRLRLAARKCCLNDKLVDKMCVSYLKQRCSPYLKDLMDNCLPNTPYEVLVEHAFQFERAKELRDLGEQDNNLQKAVKRKANGVDLVYDTLSETGRLRFKLIKSQIEKQKQKQDISNTLKQIKYSVETIITGIEHELKTFSNMAMKNNNNSLNSNVSTVKTCFHCAKPYHRYNGCINATKAEKNAIRRLLKNRKFDFVMHTEKVEKIAKENHNLNFF